MIKLTIPEFVVALFNLDPTQCRLTITGRIANLHGFACQVQSLLFDHVQYTHFSYRTTTARLCTETSDSLTDNISASSASFSIETLIDTLKNINPKPSNILASIFGKDAAWSWLWPATVFVIGAILFYLFNWFSPSFSSLTDYCLAMVSTAILFTILGTRPLRFLFDLPLFRRRFRTSLNMLVARAEIFDKVKALPSEEKELGVIPTIMKLIDEDDGKTANYVIAQLLEELKESKVKLEKATADNESLTDTKKELEGKVTGLEKDKDTLNKEKDALLVENATERQIRATVEGQFLDAHTQLEKKTKELSDEMESHSKEVKRLESEIEKVALEATESEFANMAKVLKAVLIYCEQARGVNQNELLTYFLAVQASGKPGRDGKISKKSKGGEKPKELFDTKLGKSTVERVFSKANKIFIDSNLNEEWFSEPNLIKAMIDEHHPAPKIGVS